MFRNFKLVGATFMTPAYLFILLLIMCGVHTSYCQEKGEDKVLEIKESKNGEENVLTLNLKSANIISVLRLLSKELGLNIMPSGDVTGTVDGHFVGTPEEILDLVLRYAGPYTYFKEGNKRSS